MKSIIKGIIGILLILLAAILIVQNYEQLSRTLTLKVDFKLWAYQTPPMGVYLVMIIVFLFGIFIAGFLGMIERFKLRRRIRILSKENREKDKELNSFRNLPIVESKMEDKGLVEGDQD